MTERPLSENPVSGEDHQRFAESRALEEKARRLIPGGCHTYAKGPDQYPVLSPGFIRRGLGCHVWDVDGNEYIEYNMGGRAVVLGHAYRPVVDAAREMMEQGASFTKPHEIEVACAEQFLGAIHRADMVKFTKDGSTATTAALRLARAYTGRDMVALCQNHPFFSYDDWAMAVTPLDAGIPRATADLTLSFPYNDIEACREMFRTHGDRLAAVILEPLRETPPANGFLHELRKLCHDNGTVFILDEMITGFRYHARGAQELLDITPDLSTFGKGLANGFALSALCGRRELMELGGLDHDQPRVFLLSTTHGAETHAMAAAIATMKVFEDEPVTEHLARIGGLLKQGCDEVIGRHGLEDYVQVGGYPCNLGFATRDRSGSPSQGYRSLFLQEMIRHGVLAPSFVVSYSHTERDIEVTVEAMDQALAVYALALEHGYERYLIGRPSNVVHRRFN